MANINSAAKNIIETSGTSNSIATNGDIAFSAKQETSFQSTKKIIYDDYKVASYGPIEQAQFPLLISEYTKRKKGRKNDGSTADDLVYGKSTREQIMAIHNLFTYDLAEVKIKNLNQLEDNLFLNFKIMAATLFTTFFTEMQDVVMNLIDTFRTNKSNQYEYTNPVLTRYVFEHDSTKNLVNRALKELRRYLFFHKGSTKGLEKNKLVIDASKPVFNGLYDKFAGGLTIAINDTHSFEIRLLEYNLNSPNYKGRIRVSIFDHFGLDLPDVQKIYVNLAGFRSWYILQHWEKLAKVPFITKMEMDYIFHGNIYLNG